MSVERHAILHMQLAGLEIGHIRLTPGLPITACYLVQMNLDVLQVGMNSHSTEFHELRVSDEIHQHCREACVYQLTHPIQPFIGHKAYQPR